MLGYSTPAVASTLARRALVKRLRLPSALLVLASAGLYAATVPAVSFADTEPSAEIVPAVLARHAEGLSPKVLAMALDAVAAARDRGVSGRTDRLTVIDYSLPSTEPRLWVLDLERGKVLFHELVAHGAGSGDKLATHFSNVNDSRATSLGLFLTGDTYEGGNGYSLKLKGLDAGVNDLAESRKIVIHGAWYVSDEHSRQFGMIGRSWGCPAISLQDAQPVIDAIKGGSFVYSYAASASIPPSVQRASFSHATSKSHRVVLVSNRSRHAARQARTRGKVVAASFHGRSSSRATGRSTARSLATRTAR
jgi:L,D-transpeptidase catalytic domain